MAVIAQAEPVSRSLTISVSVGICSYPSNAL